VLVTTGGGSSALNALLTTPGATRWYKAAGRRASQRIRLQVDDGGALEWLPQESIVFDAAQVDSCIELALAPQAAAIGWDIVALGRAAAGERFQQGVFAQSVSLAVDGRLQWLERTRLAGSDPLLDSPVGLAGCRVFGCLWAWGPEWTDAQMETARAALAGAAAPGAIGAALSRIEARLLVARVLAHEPAAARATLQALWSAVRPDVLGGRAAQSPRIWAT